MKFYDFYVGQVIEAGPHEVLESDVVGFARAYDPQWFHTDPVAAADGRFGGLIASGWHTCAIAMRLIVDAALHGSESFASPGIEYVKWPSPVRPGDSLRLRATVIDVRRSSTKPTLGILRWRWQLFNDQGLEVLDLEATSMFDLREAVDNGGARRRSVHPVSVLARPAPGLRRGASTRAGLRSARAREPGCGSPPG